MSHERVVCFREKHANYALTQWYTVNNLVLAYLIMMADPCCTREIKTFTVWVVLQLWMTLKAFLNLSKCFLSTVSRSA
jgi:hypothetical protein